MEEGEGEGEGGRGRETVASREEGGTRGTLEERAGRGCFFAFLLLLGPREQEPASSEKNRRRRANESRSLQGRAGQVQGRSRARGKTTLGGSNLSGGWAGDNGVRWVDWAGLSPNGQRKRRRG